MGVMVFVDLSFIGDTLILFGGGDKMKYSIDDKNVIAALVKRLRTEQSLTQQELAAVAGVSFSFVNQVERGKQTLRLDSLDKLLTVFGYQMIPQQVSHSKVVAPIQEQKVKARKVEPIQAQPRKEDWAFF